MEYPYFTMYQASKVDTKEANRVVVQPFGFVSLLDTKIGLQGFVVPPKADYLALSPTCTCPHAVFVTGLI